MGVSFNGTFGGSVYDEATNAYPYQLGQKVGLALQIKIRQCIHLTSQMEEP